MTTNADLRVRLEARSARREARRLTRDLKALSQEGTGVEKVTAGMGSGFGFLRRAMGALTAGLLTREFVRLTDTFKLQRQQLAVVVDSYGELAAAQSEVLRIAQGSGVALQSVNLIFARLTRSTKDLGVSQAEVARVTESLTKLTLISGATAQEARNALIQLSQGFASGQLRGDEFRSVAEQLPAVLEAVARATGKTRGELREMAFAGELTTEFLTKVLLSQSDVIDEHAKKIEDTFGRAWARVNNSLVRYVGEMDEALQSSKVLIGVMNSIAVNIGDVITNLGLASAAALGFFTILNRGAAVTVFSSIVAQLGMVITELSAAKLATAAFVSFFAGLTAGDILVKNFTSVRVVALEVVGTIAKAWEEVKFAGGAALIAIKETFFEILKPIRIGFGTLLLEIADGLAKIPGLAGKSASVREFGNAMISAAEGSTNFTKEIEDLRTEVEKSKKDIEQRILDLNDWQIAQENTKDGAKDLGDEIKQVHVIARKIDTSDYERKLKKIRDSYQDVQDRLNPLAAKHREFNETIARARILLNRGEISLEEYAEFVRMLTAEFVEWKKEQEKTLEVSKEVEEQAGPFEQAWIGAIERLDESFEDAWRNIFDGFDSFKEAIISSFLDLLAQLAHLAITRPILIQLGLGGAAGGAGAGAGTGLLGNRTAAGSGGGLLPAISPFGLLATGGFLGAAQAGGGLPSAAAGALGGFGFASTAIGAGLLGSGALATGLATGATVGSVVPVLGTIVGAVVGLALGRIFNNNTNTSSQITFGTGRGSSDDRIDTEFGPVFVGSGRDGFHEIQGEFTKAFKDFFDVLGQVITDPAQREAIGEGLRQVGELPITREQVESGEFIQPVLDVILQSLGPEIEGFVRGIGGSVEEQFNSLQLAINLQDLVKASDLFDNIGEAFEFISQIPGDPAENVGKLLELAGQIESTIAVLGEFADSNLADDYNAIVEASGRTLTEQIDLIDAAIGDIAGAENITAEQLGELTNLVTQRYQTELQLLAQIDSAIQDIEVGFGNEIERIRRTTQTDDQRAAELRTRINDLQFRFFQGEFEDPEEIQRVANEIRTLTGELFGLLSPEQQQREAPTFISFLEDVSEEAIRQLKGAREDVLSEAEIARGLIEDLVDTLPDPLIIAADALIAAAGAIEDAVGNQPIGDSGRGGDPGRRGGGGTGPFGNNRIPLFGGTTIPIGSPLGSFFKNPGGGDKVVAQALGAERRRAQKAERKTAEVLRKVAVAGSRRSRAVNKA